MEKKKSIPKSRAIILQKAIDEYEDCDEEGLFDAAANGDLTIYFQAPTDYEVGYLCSIKSATFQYPHQPFTKFSVEEAEKRKAIYPELKVLELIDNGQCANVDEVVKLGEKIISDNEKFSKLAPAEFEETLYCPPLHIYPDSGIYHAVYREAIVGRFPISQLTIDDYQKGQDVVVALKIGDKWCPVENKDEEYFVVTKPKIYIKEAIKANMLYVMQADVQRIFPNESSVFDAAKSQDGIKKKKVNGRKPETDARYQRWNEMADAIVKKNPNSKKTYRAVAGAIHRVVVKGPIEFYGSIRTIREHIAVKKTES